MTHVIFDPDSIDWAQYLSSQQVGQGSVMRGRGELRDENIGFKGIKYVRGWGSVRGVLSNIGRFLLPIASNLMETAKGEAINTLGKVGDDLTQGRPMLDSIKSHATQGLQNIGQKLQQCGKGSKKFKELGLSPRKNTGRLVAASKGKKQRARKGDYLDFLY